MVDSSDKGKGKSLTGKVEEEEEGKGIGWGMGEGKRDAGGRRGWGRLKRQDSRVQN